MVSPGDCFISAAPFLFKLFLLPKLWPASAQERGNLCSLWTGQRFLHGLFQGSGQAYQSNDLFITISCEGLNLLAQLANLGAVGVAPACHMPLWQIIAGGASLLQWRLLWKLVGSR